MLEHSPLLLQPWTRQFLDDGPAWIRPIHDAAGHTLGFVRYDGDPDVSWFRWFRKIRLDVFETDDASHVMTLTRLWGILSSWDVEDADLRHVGAIYPKTLVSSENQRLGFIDRDNMRIVDPMGAVLARYGRPSAGITEVEFTSPPLNPFLRMMVLGSVLTMEPMPASRAA